MRIITGVRSSTFDSGTPLQAGRTWVRFQLESFGCFVKLIPLAASGPRDDSSSQRNEYQKAAAYFTTFMYPFYGNSGSLYRVYRDCFFLFCGGHGKKHYVLLGWSHWSSPTPSPPSLVIFSSSSSDFLRSRTKWMSRTKAVAEYVENSLERYSTCVRL